MLPRVLALILLLPAAAPAQELDWAVSALVQISGERGGTPVRGSGFVVSRDGDKATIVTAAHVVEGVEKLAVTFAADPSESLPALGPVRMDAGSRYGLAVFQARGIPAGVTVLSFETENRPAMGAALFLLGFPQRAITPRTAQRVLANRRGMLLEIDQGIGEGFSGGPVLLDGKVVGVVTDTDHQTTYAVNAVVAREVLVGWGVRLGAAAGSPTQHATSTEPAPPRLCVLGEERTEAGMVFVRICPGTFIMGSAANDPLADADEKPAHEVMLSEFWIGKTEVTNEQYGRFRPNHQGEGRLPITDVSWDEAKQPANTSAAAFPPRRSGSLPRALVAEPSGRSATARRCLASMPGMT